MIYDPLPEMNQAKVITIPAHSTGIIFVEFDCHGAAAGKYTGSLRIIPLNEWANFKRHQYSGALKDYPLELEIMDITLPEPMPANMFWQGISQDYVNKFQRLGQPILMVSSFYFPFKFDEKGNILEPVYGYRNSRTDTVDSEVEKIISEIYSVAECEK